MEREVEELRLLGDGGEALNILLRSSRRRSVRTLSLTLLLPLCFATLVLCLMPGHLELYDSNQDIVYMLEEAVEPVDSLAGNETLYTITSESMYFQQPRTTSRAYEFWMLLTAAVIYTAASIYTLHDGFFANLTVVPRVWKRLALTLLWFFTIVLLHTTAYIMLFLLLMYTVGFDKYVNSREFLLETIPILAVFFCVVVYINMVGYLACSISVSVLQEQYYSLAAMRKTRRLIKGKRTTVLSFVMIYFIFSQGSGLFCYAVAHSSTYRDVWGRAVYATFLGGLLSLVMLWGLVTQTEL